jgi:hypothetical protein
MKNQQNAQMIYIFSIQTSCGKDVWIVENIFINNYILDKCTQHYITYSATAHSEDGQARPKHVGATN